MDISKYDSFFLKNYAARVCHIVGQTLGNIESDENCASNGLQNFKIRTFGCNAIIGLRKYIYRIPL